VAAPTAAWYSFGLQLMECAMCDFVFEFDMLQGWWSDEWKKILTLGIYESRTQEPQFFLSPIAWFKDVFTGCVYRFFLIDMMFICLFLWPLRPPSIHWDYCMTAIVPAIYCMAQRVFIVPSGV
jgi:hypothetical protein